MPINKLDHVNIRTKNLDTMIDWYTNVLEFKLGKRPDFPFPGAWMYLGDAPVVHIIAIQGKEGIGSEEGLKLQHFAFSAFGRAEFQSRLDKLGEKYKPSKVPSLDIVQINIWDPDGNHIHVDFPLDE